MATNTFCAASAVIAEWEVISTHRRRIGGKFFDKGSLVNPGVEGARVIQDVRNVAQVPLPVHDREVVVVFHQNVE